MQHKKNIVIVFTTLWAITIMIFSGIPGNAIKLPPIWNLDKFLHLGVYLVLAFLLFYSFFYSKRESSIKRIAIQTFIIVVVYGGIIEILQQYVFIGRFGDILDFTANSIGAFLGSVIPVIISINKTTKKQPPRH